MSQTLFIADTHFTVSNLHGLNNLKFEILQRIVDKYGQKADMIVHLGDGSDRPGINAEIQTREAQIWRSLGASIEKLHYALGNHELLNGQYAPISAFQEGTRCGGRGMQVVGRDALYVAPFVLRGWSPEPMFDRNGSTDCKYFCGHVTVNYGSQHFFGPDTPTAQELNQLEWEHILLGDIHHPHDVGKVHSIGAMFPNSFNDRDIQAGFVIFDMDTGEIKRHTIDDYPIFRIVDVNEDTTLDFLDEKKRSGSVTDNIVRLKISGSSGFIKDKFDKIEKYFRQMNPRSLEVMPIVTSQSKTVVQVSYQSPKDLVLAEASLEKWPESTKNLAVKLMGQPPKAEAIGLAET